MYLTTGSELKSNLGNTLLRIVAGLAEGWGVTAVPGAAGKVVWADVPLV